MKTDSSLTKQVTWEQIEALISEDKYKSFLKEIDPSVFKLVLDESKRPQVTASILTMLQSREPENATEEYTEEIINLMIKVAKKFRTYKSFLMGAKNITDADLTDLNLDILRDNDPEVRKLIIPEKSIEKYKDLIRSKLDAGYWNEFVGEDQIYFIFKMADDEIKEYEYNESSRLEIAALCTKLNNDPIEKTSNLLDYLAQNEFYTDIVKDFIVKHQ